MLWERKQERKKRKIKLLTIPYTKFIIENFSNFPRENIITFTFASFPIQCRVDERGTDDEEPDNSLLLELLFVFQSLLAWHKHIPISHLRGKKLSFATLFKP